MIILVIGPSGIGKTAACKAVEPLFSDCVFEALDRLSCQRALRLGLIERPDINLFRTRIGDDKLFLAFGLEAIGECEAEHPGKHVVIDVGAGFQDAKSAEDLSRLYTVIAITAEPDVAYCRFEEFRGRRDRKNFMQAEFNEHRTRLYAGAHHIIDTTRQSPEETRDEFARILAMSLR